MIPLHSEEVRLSFLRRVGKWNLAGLVINSIVGSSIFGLPSELTRLLGSASTLAVLLGGVATAVVMACFAEVASQFSEPGGPYLYARHSFGSFVGIQVGWFAWLTRVASAAANAALFGGYFAGLVPSMGNWYGRCGVIAVALSSVVCSNYVGVRRGAELSTAAVVARLVPLLALIVLGIPLMARHPVIPSLAQIAAPGGRNWFDALLLISFLYGGYDSATMPMGEVESPRRSVPFALAIGLLTCVLVYTLCQQLVVVTIGASGTERPLAEAAGQLLGRTGAVVISLAALISIFGYLSAVVLNVPRLMYAMAEKGEFPSWFGRIHSKFQTPHVAIIAFGALVFVMAVTGGFRWAVAVSAGARLLTYASVCAAVMPLRRKNPHADALRIPLAPFFSALGILMACVLVVRIHQKEAAVLFLTATAATINWLFARRYQERTLAKVNAQS